jgi:hypothetical protein
MRIDESLGERRRLGMGLKVSAREAARLAHRTERTIRAWVASGKLTAEPAGPRGKRRGVGPNRWMIDSDDLAAMPGVEMDRALLAEMQARAALTGSGTNVLERVSRLERDVADLRRAVDDLRGNPPSGEPRDG